MSERQLFTAEYCAPFFPAEAGFNFQIMPASEFDRRRTVPGDPLRCVDRRNGMTAQGYKVELVPKSYAFPGAGEGVAAFAKAGLLVSGIFFEDNHPETYLGWAIKAIRGIGHEPAWHGDLVKRRKGCAFGAELEKGDAGSFVDLLQPLTEFEREYLELKYGMHYTELYPDAQPAVAVALSPKPKYALMPDGGRIYPFDIDAPLKMGILPYAYMQIVARCAEALLPKNERNQSGNWR